MWRVFLLMLVLPTVGAYGLGLDLSCGYPTYSPYAEGEDAVVRFKESRVYVSAGYPFEAAEFLETGPRLAWARWDFRTSQSGYVLDLHKLEFAWSVTPRKKLTGRLSLFLDASFGLEYMNYTLDAPVVLVADESVLSKSEWGFGRSLGVGLKYGWLGISVHHDAFLAESLLREFAGVRFSVGILLRKRP